MERTRLAEAYKQAINQYIQAAGNLRYSDTEDLTALALIATEEAQRAFDAARQALDGHVLEHGCGRTLELTEPVWE